jgi:GNAT superfamily N-acetyltransferase
VNAGVRIVEEALTAAALEAYGKVSIAFQAASVLRLEPLEGGLGGIRLVETVVESFVKDYDIDESQGPQLWLRWATPRSSIFAAFAGDERVGGAVVFTHTQGMQFLRGRTEIAALWDIRVAPAWRGRGVGHQLFAAAIDWCRRNGCRRLKIETQNINVAACRFYAAQGCYLGGIDRHAYADYPDEVELIWYYDLA